MAETLATANIDEVLDGEAPGWYFTIEDAEGGKTEPIGPYKSAELAETAVMESLQTATTDIVKDMLGL